MELRWCNKAFTSITGYTPDEIEGKRGSTILIGPDMAQDRHLHIIERLMNWENFTSDGANNRKSGERYWQRMTWVHLTDPDTGDHWWMCSVIELDDPIGAPTKAVDADHLEIDQDSYTLALEKVHRLEKENKRLHKLAQSVAKDANEDALTGLSNRRHFEVELKTWSENLRTKGVEFAVLYIDLDRFKFVNDTLGHDAGDRLLVSVAETLRRLTDPSDLVARLGGDEFVILKPLGKSALNISSLADEIVSQLQVPFSVDGRSTACSVSVGVAIAKVGTDDPVQVVADSDLALYHAKSQGKACWSFFTEEMHAEAVANKRLSSDLLRACDRQEFEPYFQPMVDAATGRIVAAEALVRWTHPTRGILAPGSFLGAAETMGILKRIDEIVFANLQGALAKFDAVGVDLPRVSVNVSSARLADPAFLHEIMSSGIRPDRLTIEILESVYLDYVGDGVRWTLDELDRLGVTIAIDDFGTGHASVRGLLRIRPAILKIDRFFIEPVVEHESARALAASIIGIGKSQGMSIVAEGIESLAHAEVASDLGCDFLQGYYFGKPMSQDALCARLVETEGQFWPGRETRAAKRAAG